jgi:hypothetical protein
MDHTIAIQPWVESALQAKKNGSSLEEALQALKEKGLDESMLPEITLAVKAKLLQRARNAGYVWTGVAFFLLSFGFLLTLLLFDAGMNFNVAMYGLTLLGVGCAFKGIVNIMGW